MSHSGDQSFLHLSFVGGNKWFLGSGRHLSRHLQMPLSSPMMSVHSDFAEEAWRSTLMEPVAASSKRSNVQHGSMAGLLAHGGVPCHTLVSHTPVPKSESVLWGPH